jgi:hypothetical protein
MLDAFSRSIVGWRWKFICAPNWCCKRLTWPSGSAASSPEAVPAIATLLARNDPSGAFE